MGFKTTGVRLIANVTQFVSELRRSSDVTKNLGKDFDDARIKAARMNNEIARTSTAGGKALADMTRDVERLDERIEVARRTVQNFAIASAQGLGGEQTTKNLRKAQAELANLLDLRKLLPDPRVAEEQAEGFATRWAKSFGNALQTRLVLAAAPGFVPLLPVVGSAIAGAVVGAAGAGGVVGGIAIASRDDRVKAAAAALGQTIMGDLTNRADDFVPATLRAIERVRIGWLSLGPDLDRVFRAERFVDPLVDGAVEMGREFLKGFADAVDDADPVIEALRQMMAQTGTALGGFFSSLSDEASSSAAALNDVTMAVSHFIGATGLMLSSLGNTFHFTQELDKIIDRTRFWIEDNNNLNEGLGVFGKTLDLTADGFARGSVQAEAYRKATLGTATANDFATLKLAGKTDAEIEAIDQSGKYREVLAQVEAKVYDVTQSEEARKAAQAAVTAAQKELTAAQQSYKTSLDMVSPALFRAKQFADGLKTATDNLYGAAIRGSEANELYEKSWDDLSEAVKDNGNTLNIHTAKGRANRDMLEALLQSSNEMYFSDIALGKAEDGARRKHEERTEAIRRQGEKLGLNKKQTEALIKTYGNIQPSKETKLVLSGLQNIADKLTDLYIAQRALAEGKTVSQIRGGYQGGSPRLFKAEGGPIHGPGTGTSDSIPAMLSHGEYVVKAKSTSAIGVKQLNYMNKYGELPHYAAGGLIADVDPAKVWPFRANLAGTFIMSMKAALAKVAPNFGNWPSSPSAQRGDSGVWRRIVQLINSTGPMSGHFGNAYRPGDPLWHGSGRAVDWMGYNQDRLASFLAARRPLELIHRTRRRDYAYTRGVNKGSFNQALMNAHQNHIHIAMANGGVIGEPVFGIGASGRSYSFAESGPEVVMPIGGGGRGGSGNITVYVQAGYVVSERDLENKITATIDTLRNKGRV